VHALVVNDADERYLDLLVYSERALRLWQGTAAVTVAVEEAEVVVYQLL
jgi:hypothetical protein